MAFTVRLAVFPPWKAPIPYEILSEVFSTQAEAATAGARAHHKAGTRCACVPPAAAIGGRRGAGDHLPASAGGIGARLPDLRRRWRRGRQLDHARRRVGACRRRRGRTLKVSALRFKSTASRQGRIVRIQRSGRLFSGGGAGGAASAGSSARPRAWVLRRRRLSRRAALRRAARSSFGGMRVSGPSMLATAYTRATPLRRWRRRTVRDLRRVAETHDRPHNPSSTATALFRQIGRAIPSRPRCARQECLELTLNQFENAPNLAAAAEPHDDGAAGRRRGAEERRRPRRMGDPLAVVP